MTWQEAVKVGTVVVTSLGGGGAIVLGLSKLIADRWAAQFKGDIDAKLRRLDARLEHGNFLLQRFAEFELEASSECWRKARHCLLMINATRPIDSGTDEVVLQSNRQALSEAHNALLSALGDHEPFLPEPVALAVSEITRVARLELSQIKTQEHFKGDWWEKGEKNRADIQKLTDALLFLVKGRIAELRNMAERP